MSVNKRVLTIFWGSDLEFTVSAKRWQLGKLIIIWGGPKDLEDHVKEKGLLEGISHFEYDNNKSKIEKYVIHYKNPLRSPQTVKFSTISEDSKDGLYRTFRRTEASEQLYRKLMSKVE